MQQVLSTHRPWFIRLVDAIVERRRARRRHAALRDLDARTLADIGVDASEVSSIAAEAASQACLTRLRIVADGHHG